MDSRWPKIAFHAAERGHQDDVREFCLRGMPRLAPEGCQRLLQALVDEVVLRSDVI